MPAPPPSSGSPGEQPAQPSDVPSHRQCNRCKKVLELTAENFPPRKRGSSSGPDALSAKCTPCMEYDKLQKSRKRARDHRSSDDRPDPPAPEVITEAELINRLENTNAFNDDEPEVHLDASLKLDGPPSKEKLKERAEEIAEMIGKRMGLAWVNQVKTIRKRTDDVRFSFACAQSNDRENKKKNPKESGSRDVRRMERYDCHGWLHIILKSGSRTALLKMKHEEPHPPYTDIELPGHWKAYIEEQIKTGATPGEIWRHIEQQESLGRSVKEVNIAFRPKAVSYYWRTVASKRWKLTPDPFTSAREYIHQNSEKEHVALLDVAEEPGTQVLAFQVTDFVSEWAAHTQELAMDSTWNTNGSNFELFAAVGSAEGVGVPLAFLMIKTSKEAQAGAKEAVLTSFLEQLKALGVDPEFTLTDKDWSEINAMRTVWPNSKHILCFWHGLRALKQRLSKPKERPGPYDPEAAHREFEFIDKSFVPLGQRSEPEANVPPKPPEKPLPKITLLVGGRPSVITPALPKIRLTVRLPGENSCATAPAAAPAVDVASNNPPLDDLGSEPEDDRSDAGNFFADQAEAAERESAAVLQDNGWFDADDPESGEDDNAEFNERMDVARIASEADSVPMQEETVPPPQSPPPESTQKRTGARPKDPEYIFCPLAHRLPIMRLFGKHASLHPLLPERHGQPRSADQIRRDAVHEMYHHCYRNNLREVWAYLWNSWYSRDRWRLWTRSSHPISISNHRTTMMVEALWRVLKGLVLHRHNRPALDYTVFSIVTKLIPTYRGNLASIVNDPRPGRPKPLTNAQSSLKMAWDRLAESTIKGSYNTDLTRWTCECGAQKYHAHLLCKHLVQSAPPIPPAWWPKAVRYHIPPFYTIPMDSKTADPPESKRDHAWLERIQPQDRRVSRPLRSADADSTAAHDDTTPDRPDSPLPPSSPGSYTPSSPIDQLPSGPILSSPSKPSRSDGLMRTRAGGGAGFEVDDFDSSMKDLANRLRRAANIIDDQRERNDDPRFLLNARQAMKRATKWTTNVENHIHRRTIPKTNTPDSTDVIGYKY
ncbi:hypothetical protein EIP91_007458 [Steccherinum ochraceum]|uniref:MULE transposase domain-containing protein n=1 Tax=Steccherinum ochraceum TaxID=92696 RepID=A0A4R0R4A9_9APHY|nr:hypothetical protein EIP91_007458 [Steccherinum ochraceum]